MDDSALQHDIFQLIWSISGKGPIVQIKDMLLHNNQKYCGIVSLKNKKFYFIKFVFYLLYIIVTHSSGKRPLEGNTKFSFLL